MSIRKVLDSYDLKLDGVDLPDGAGVQGVVVAVWVRNARAELEAKDSAIRKALDWLDKFGEHAPIVFGGEQELHDILHTALGGEVPA